MKRSVFVVLAVLLPLWSPAADVPLLDAIRRDDQPIVRDLIKKGGAESVRDESGATALMYAAVFASPATLQLLLESGADINASNNNDDALQAASALLQLGLHNDAVSRAYYAAFHYARALLLLEGLEPKTHRGVVALLLEHYESPGRLEAGELRLVRRGP